MVMCGEELSVVGCVEGVLVELVDGLGLGLGVRVRFRVRV